MASRYVFHGRSRFHPARSILGQLCLRSIKDERKAEAWYLILASATVVAGAIGVMAVTGLWDVLGWDEQQVWLWPWAVFGLLLASCLVGFVPGVKVELTKLGLVVRQGRRSTDIRFADITRCDVVSALVYYRNYAMYRDTLRYLTRIPEDILVLTVTDRHVAIGFCPVRHADLNAIIQKELVRPSTTGEAHYIGHGV